MNDADHPEIECDPRYLDLLRRRGRLTGGLVAIILSAYFGFILLVGFARPLLARPIGDGVTSLGIVLGVALIGLTIVLTGIYVRQANKVFDPLIKSMTADQER